MGIRFIQVVSVLSCLIGSPTLAQEPVLPPAEQEPLLRLEAGGPTSFVTALAFSPNGRTLYAAGLDKVVRTWSLEADTGKFVLDETASYRIPIGPGQDGAINAVALSSDGTWLAVAGNGVVRQKAGIRQSGWIVPQGGGMSNEMRLDRGMIYVFNTRDQAVRLLRGHLGPVVSLAFAPIREGDAPQLVSAAYEIKEDGGLAGVLRVWDVERATLGRGFMPPDLPKQPARPGLTVWRGGTQPNRLTVAAAWGDGLLRVWDVQSQTYYTVRDGQYNSASGYLPDPGAVITGSRDVLRLWTLPVRDGQNRQLALGRGGIVRALAPFSARGDSRFDHVAAVLHLPAQTSAEAQLQVVDLDRPNDPATKLTLWQGAETTPVIAAAPGGQHVAVAGNKDHSILVFSIPGLLTGRAEPQKLRGAGIAVKHVSFVKRGESVGILLRERAAGGPEDVPDRLDGDLVFDFKNHTLTSASDDWLSAAAVPHGWNAKHLPARQDGDKKSPWLISVSRDGVEQRRIVLKSGQELTAYTLLPPTPPVASPLLAVSYFDYEAGEAMLCLYEAASGEQVRQYTGHSDRIRSLAFSGDGRLLASSSDDQTVCIWSLTDLDEVLAARGTLPGVVVQQKEGGIVVGEIEPGSPIVREQLSAGDIIHGLVIGGELRPLNSPQEFYLTLSRIKPSETIVLRRSRAGSGPRDIELKLVQGVDERKPLLSLFLTRQQDNQQPGWIGWSPLGFYEVSGRASERLLGWHFNTGNPLLPASFAHVDQYRKDYLRPGILEELIERGRFQPPPRDEPLKAPEMTLRLEQPDQPSVAAEGADPVVLHNRQVRITLALYDEFPPEKVDQVEWRLQEPVATAPGEGTLKRSSSREWSADLSSLIKDRGVYRLVVRIRSRETVPQLFTKELTLRYQPPPPLVSWEMPERRLLVHSPDFALQAAVRSAQAGEEFSVQLLHNRKEIVPSSTHETPLQIQQPLQLAQGQNLVEVVAVNRHALAGHEDAETSRQMLEITYYPPAVPEIVLDAVVPLSGPEEGQPLPIAAGKPVLLSGPRLLVKGKIKASDENLTLANWRLDDAADAAALTQFETQKARVFDINEPLNVAPGAHTLRFSAGTANSPAATATLDIEYQPEVPQVSLVAPAQGTTLYEGRDPARIELEGELVLPEDRQAFQVSALVNGEQLDEAVDVDEANDRLRVQIPLRSGLNRIQLRTRNEWNRSWTSDVVQLRYLRPPRVVAVTHAEIGRQAIVDVTAQVESPDELPLTRVEVNGRALPPQSVADESKAAAGAGRRWRITAPDVPLRPGPNRIEVAAWNEHGRCLEEGSIDVTFMPAPPPRADVAILSPRNVPVSTASYQIRFRVSSSSPLKRVEVVRDHRSLAAPDLTGLKKTAQGLFELDQSLVLMLERGDNHFEVVALNDGGEQSAAVDVSYVAPPVQVVIDRLEYADESAGFMTPERRENGPMVFAVAAREPQVTLRGRVIWPDQLDPRLREANELHVWINGIQQLVAPLGTPRDASLEREFKAEVLLNHTKANHVELELPGWAHEATSRLEFKIDCDRPRAAPRLHLLIVGAGEKDKKKLKNQAMQALHARPTTADDFTLPAFSSGHLYATLTRPVAWGEIKPQLDRIRNDIKTRKSPNDVVIIYYQGGESVNNQGQFVFRTSYGEQTMTSSYLENFFGDLQGAKILLLDVTREAASTEVKADWPDNSRIGVLRYAWLEAGDSPPDARLIVALEQATAKASKLKDVESFVSQSYQQLRQKYPESLAYKPHVPESLGDLIVGATQATLVP